MEDWMVDRELMPHSDLNNENRKKKRMHLPAHKQKIHSLAGAR
jgi:hypothetical protein